MKEQLISEILQNLQKVKSGENIRLCEMAKDVSILNEGEKLKAWQIITQKAKQNNITLQSVYPWPCQTGIPFDDTYMVKRKPGKAYIVEDCTEISYISGGYLCSVPSINVTIKKCDASQEVWDDLLDKVFKECGVLKWYDTYQDFGVVDGYYWNMTLKFKGQKPLHYSGSNKGPSKLHALEKALRPYSKH